jgi:hypothetical protein
MSVSNRSYWLACQQSLLVNTTHIYWPFVWREVGGTQKLRIWNAHVSSVRNLEEQCDAYLRVRNNMIWPIRSDKSYEYTIPSGPIRSFQPDLPILAASPPLLGSSPTRVWWKPTKIDAWRAIRWGSAAHRRTWTLPAGGIPFPSVTPSAAPPPMTSRPAEPGVASRSLPLLFSSLHPALMNHWL